MTLPKRLLAGVFLAFLLIVSALSAALAAQAVAGQFHRAPAARRPGPAALVLADAVKGAQIYRSSALDTLAAIVNRLTGKKINITGELQSCEDPSDCPVGYACLNACEQGKDCDVFVKRCLQGPEQIKIEPPFSACGRGDVCGKGTACARTCPSGVSCPVTHRCLPAQASEGACANDLGCLALCNKKGFPPVGVGYRAVCENGDCHCRLQEINPGAPRVSCTDAIRADQNMACPDGTTPACTPGANGAPRLTCLTAPEFGGQCTDDASCGNISCPTGAAPFCDKDQKCRCRAVEERTIACASDDQCGSITCDANQKKVCASGACACAQTNVIEQEAVCKTAADCPATCAQGYSTACVSGKCACQRTKNVPVACRTVNDCSAIACPADYQKTCLKNVCSCVRSTTQSAT